MSCSPRPRAGGRVAQWAVEAKSNEISALPDLITALGERVKGAVITADALHTQTATATTILAAGADYVFTVKANQPGLHKALKGLPWARVRQDTWRMRSLMGAGSGGP